MPGQKWIRKPASAPTRDRARRAPTPAKRRAASCAKSKTARRTRTHRVCCASRSRRQCPRCKPSHCDLARSTAVWTDSSETCQTAVFAFGEASTSFTALNRLFRTAIFPRRSHAKIVWMNFSDFAALCYALEKTPSRLAKVAAAADYLRRLEPDEIRPGVAFLSGRPFPVSDPRTLDIGPGAFSHAAEVPQVESSILPPLKIKDVALNFEQIAEASGKGSREQKYTRLRELVEMTSAEERLILFRLLHNELRIGLHDGLIL